MKRQVAIVIPIIAPTATGDELEALRQCLRVLKARDIYYLCSESLDTTFHERLNAEHGVQFRKRTFPAGCFADVKAYNRLCFNAKLYTAFDRYEYILIYQLDAYVFEDRLDDWCTRGYDYVGGPWLCPWSGEVENLDHWETGNGGFSLRRVDAFTKLLTDKRMQRKPLKPYSRLCLENNRRLRRNPALRLWYALRALAGHHNTLQYYIEKNAQEDKAYAQCQYNGLLRIPAAREAMGFSFDMRPATCFKLNGNRLPMGCHMWYKYGNGQFWYPIIYGENFEKKG